MRLLAQGGLSSPVTTSMGRLFDAVAALCGMRVEVNYEGQAAIELEARCDEAERGSYPIELADGPDGLVLDPREAIRAIVADIAAATPVGVIASRFHRAVAVATAAACARLASDAATETVILSGGVFQNARLLASTAAVLSSGGLRVLTPERLPANDGGIAYGQAATAARRLACAR